MRPSKPELPGPRHTTGRAEQFRFCCDANRLLRLLEIPGEIGIRVAQSWPISEVVISDLVSGNFDTRNNLRKTQGAFANEKERCLGVVLLKNFKDLGREGWMWPVVEGKGNHRTVSPNSIGNIGRQSLEHAQNSEGLDPEHQKHHPEESGGRQEHSHHVSTLPYMSLRTADGTKYCRIN
jgi:hypothetical protein